MNTDTAHAHVDAETMAAWADRALPAEEAAAVELHLSNCDRCQEVLAAFMRSEPVAGAVVIPFWGRRPVQWSAAGLAAAAAIVAMIWVGRPPSATAPESTVASAPVQPAPVPPPPVSQPSPSSQPSLSTPLDRLQEKAAEKPREERRRDQPARALEDKAVANQSMAKKAEGRVAGGATALPPPVAAAQQAVPAPPPPPAPVSAPPPVAVTGATSAATPVAAPRPSAMYESIARDASSFAIPPAFEIVAPDTASLASRSAVGGGGGGGGGGRGGAAAAKALTLSPGAARWRVIAGTRVERTLDAGVTWAALQIEPALKTPLLAGSATSPFNCWLVGREGVVLVTTDGLTFRRISVPEAVHLTGVTALDNLRATVTAIDGRKFATTDGGLTWK